MARVGTASLEDKDGLRAHWNASMAQTTSLRFGLDHVLRDAAARELAVVYDAEINRQRMRACEMMRFDAAGDVVWGEAMCGATLERGAGAS